MGFSVSIKDANAAPYLHYCPQKNDFSPSGADGQQSLDLKSLPSCIVPFVYGEAVLSSKCTNQGSLLHCKHKLHYSACESVS